MYGLVRGREAIPFRKAAGPGDSGTAPTRADADADETFLLGLPFYRRGNWLRWALPLAVVLLLALISVALWQTIRSLSQPVASTTPVADASKPGNNDQQTTNPDPTKPNGDAKKTSNEGKAPDSTDVKKPEGNGKKPDGGTAPIVEDKKPEPSVADRKKPPLTDRLALGKHYFDQRSTPSLLVARKDEQDDWHRLTPGALVYSNDRLVSLPGYASEVRLDNGVHLLLRSFLKEFTPADNPEMYYLQESAVILHKNPDVDTDLTFQRGRLYISNHKDKDPARIRLRFETEVWDLTLQPGAEVVLDLLRRYRGDEPAVTLHFLLIAGNAGMVIDGNHHPNLSAPPGRSYFLWESKPVRPGPNPLGPAPVDTVRSFFDKGLRLDPANRTAEAMEMALKPLSQRVVGNKPLTVALEEVLQTEPAMQPAQHVLAIYCLGALDEIKALLRILGSTDTVQRLDRDTAIFALRRWLRRDVQNGPRLYDAENKSGLLISSGQEYRSNQAETIFRLLHDFSVDDLSNRETYDALASDLLSDKVAIAELAHWHLARLTYSKNVPELQTFDATAPKEARESTALAVRRAVEKAIEGQSPAKPGAGKPDKDPPKPR
jgi:hypothetical protein